MQLGIFILIHNFGFWYNPVIKNGMYKVFGYLTRVNELNMKSLTDPYRYNMTKLYLPFCSVHVRISNDLTRFNKMQFTF